MGIEVGAITVADMDWRRYLDPTTAWRQTSDVEKVRAYTRQSFVSIVAATGIAAIVIAVEAGNWFGVGVSAPAALFSCLTLQRIPEMGGQSSGGVSVPLLATLALSAAACLALGAGGTVIVAVLVVIPCSALVSFRLSALASIAVGVVVGLVGSDWWSAAGIALVIVSLAMTVRLSIWLLRIVTELDSARHAAGLLSVAEERLRFSRDVHDVVGRALSAIAVKSELAATLARRGDARAADQMDEVRTLAQESMTETRELVRGYRSIDLSSEVTGARSLLGAAGISTEVVGVVGDVDAAGTESAAWVVREGTTNVLRHSSATFCRIELNSNGIRMINDGAHPHGSRGDGTGIRGLRERLAAVGGTVETLSTADEFVLAATFDTKGAS